MAQHAPQVAHAVTVGVGEAPWVHLIHDPPPPPVIGHGGLQAQLAEFLVQVGPGMALADLEFPA